MRSSKWVSSAIAGQPKAEHLAGDVPNGAEGKVSSAVAGQPKAEPLLLPELPSVKGGSFHRP